MASTPFAVVDVETTGFRDSDRIVEVAVVMLDDAGRVEGRWQSLVQPDRDIANAHVHGITAAVVAGAPSFPGIAAELAGLLDGRILVAHNAALDVRFLRSEFARVGVELPPQGWWVCTQQLSGRLLPGAPGSLAECLAAAGLGNDAPHTALGDATATAELFGVLRGHGADPAAEAQPLVLGEDTRAPLAGPPAVPALPRTPEGSGRAAWVRRIAAAGSAAEAGDGGEVPGRGGPVASASERSGAGRYLAHLTDVLADGRIDDAESDGLVDCAHAAGLDADDVAELHDRFLRMLAVDAWADGVVTGEERAWLIRVADELDVPRHRVVTLLAAPDVTPGPSVAHRLRPGDRVAFTGTMALSREEWIARAEAAGLEVGGVRRDTCVLVAADVESRSGKSRLARRYGIPVIDEASFADLLREFIDGAGAGEPDGADAVTTDAAPPADADDPIAATGPHAVFPWLAGDVGAEPTAADIAEAWILDRADVPLMEMSPVLSADVRPEGLDAGLSVVASWYRAYPEPLSATVEDLLDIRGVGALRLRTFVGAVALHAIDAAAAGQAEEADAPGDAYADLPGGDLVSAFYGDAAPDDATPGGATPGPDTPGEAARGGAAGIVGGESSLDRLALGWLDACGAAMDAGGRHAPEPIADVLAGHAPATELINQAVADIHAAVGDDSREVVIANERLFGSVTLAELGDRFGVSRERIGQLERGIRTRLATPTPAVTVAVDALGRRFGPLSRVTDVREELPPLARRSSILDADALDLLALAAGGSWRLDDGWFLVGDIVKRISGELAATADPYGVVHLDELAGRLGIAPGILSRWLTDGGEAQVRDGWIRTRTGSIPERAAAELSIHGASLTTEELAGILADRSERSISNALSLAEGIHRCGHGRWALAEWNLDEWTNLADFIARRVDAAGDDGVPLDALVDAAAERGVARSSVVTYASGPEFDISDGIVRRTDADPVNDALPEETANLYLRDGAWSLLITVNRDHVRGSGVPVPKAVAALYDVAYLGEVRVPSPAGEQAVRWGRTNASISTIRRFVEALGLAEGDRCWLRFAADGFDVLPATPRESAADPAADLLNRCGLDDVAPAPADTADTGAADSGTGAAGSVDEALGVLAEAMGLPAGVARRRIVSRLRHRRQEDLADFVRAL